MAGESLRVTGSLTIPLEQLEWRFSASGGPGGQHANTANSRVELRFDVAGSPVLGLGQRERLLERLGPVVRVVVSQERSQLRNRELALSRLAERLAEALEVPRVRHPTRRSTGSQVRRVETKRRHGQRKRQRDHDRRPEGED